MLSILVEAVRSDIESDYARSLAKMKFKISIQPDGTTLPLLQICILGSLTLYLSEQTETKLTQGELTPNQRSLLTLLISSPERQISREKVQLILWPDISPDKAKIRFDTLMSRTRKTLSNILTPYPVHSFFGIKQGIVYLNNYWIDSLEFSGKVREGIRLCRSEKWWQAGNSFSSAIELWKGCLSLISLVKIWYRSIALSCLHNFLK